jgi:hypothetical protein
MFVASLCHLSSPLISPLWEKRDAFRGSFTDTLTHAEKRRAEAALAATLAAKKAKVA